ncbi:hypothetical protein KI387_005714, partial [Taxus chinensis]
MDFMEGVMSSMDNVTRVIQNEKEKITQDQLEAIMKNIPDKIGKVLSDCKILEPE